MRTISIRELHTFTGRFVREAREESLMITDRGQPVAILKSVQGMDMMGKPLPKRDLSELPKSKIDSTVLISEDRDHW